MLSDDALQMRDHFVGGQLPKLAHRLGERFLSHSFQPPLQQALQGGFRRRVQDQPDGPDRCSLCYDGSHADQGDGDGHDLDNHQNRHDLVDYVEHLDSFFGEPLVLGLEVLLDIDDALDMPLRVYKDQKFAAARKRHLWRPDLSVHRVRIGAQERGLARLLEMTSDGHFSTHSEEVFEVGHLGHQRISRVCREWTEARLVPEGWPLCDIRRTITVMVYFRG